MADDQTMRDHIEDLMEVEAKLRRYIDYLSGELKKAEIRSSRWRKIADNLYDKVMIAYCWHCGSEKVRECYVDNVATDYRQAVVDEEVIRG